MASELGQARKDAGADKGGFILSNKRLFPKRPRGVRMTTGTLKALARLAGRSKSSGNISAAEEQTVVRWQRAEMKRRGILAGSSLLGRK